MPVTKRIFAHNIKAGMTLLSINDRAYRVLEDAAVQEYGARVMFPCIDEEGVEEVKRTDAASTVRIFEGTVAEWVADRIGGTTFMEELSRL